MNFKSNLSTDIGETGGIHIETLLALHEPVWKIPGLFLPLGFPGVGFTCGIEGCDQTVIKLIENLKILRDF